MDHNEPIYELSAWDWSGAHERFFDQHVVGKRLSNDPYAKSHHITFTDGTAVALTDSGRNRVYHVNKTAYEGAGVIERAWIDHEDAPGTYTQRLYVQCENEDEPRSSPKPHSTTSHTASGPDSTSSPSTRTSGNPQANHAHDREKPRTLRAQTDHACGASLYPRQRARSGANMRKPREDKPR